MLTFTITFLHIQAKLPYLHISQLNFNPNMEIAQWSQSQPMHDIKTTATSTYNSFKRLWKGLRILICYAWPKTKKKKKKLLAGKGLTSHPMALYGWAQKNTNTKISSNSKFL